MATKTSLSAQGVIFNQLRLKILSKEGTYYSFSTNYYFEKAQNSSARSTGPTTASEANSKRAAPVP